MGISVVRWVRYIALALIGILIVLTVADSLGLLPSRSSRLLAPSAGATVIQGFSLVDQRGRPVTEKDVLGKPALIFFGFTFCPEVCPTTLADISNWMNAIGPQADRLRVFFVTVDPERDTPDVMANYISPFDRRIVGLTGTPDQIAAIAQPLGVYYARVKTDDGNYTMDHTSSIFLIDGEGRFRGTIAYQENRETALAKINMLAGGE